nr:hypothetical protein [Tanacetum cinerariifolium]
MPFGPSPSASGGYPHLSDQDPGSLATTATTGRRLPPGGGYSQTKRDGRVSSSRRIRVGSWNIGTLTGKFLELVDALRRKKVDIACFQETKWKGSRTREGNQYKLWYSGSATARNGVGVVVAPYLKDKVVQQLISVGDLNGHIEVNADGFSSVHGGFGYGVRNEEGRTILEFTAAHDLVVVNSFFKKKDALLIAFHSRVHDTQIDYMLVRKGDLRPCKDCKVFSGEVCFSQHRLLALYIHIKKRPRLTERAVKPRILWKNLYGEAAEAFRARVIEEVTLEEEDRPAPDAEQMWNRLVNTIREADNETLRVVAGTMRSRIGRKESWWISDEVQDKVKAKQTQFKELISMRGEDEANRSAAEERYKEAKREAKKAVARAKEKAYEDLYKRLDSKEGEHDIYKIAKARDRRKMDLGIMRFIKHRDGRSVVNEDAIRRRWKEYFFDLFNGQRSARTEEVDSISASPQINCYCLRIKHSEVKEALQKMGRNKAERERLERGRGNPHWRTILEPKESFRYLGSVMHKSGRIEDDGGDSTGYDVRVRVLAVNEVTIVNKMREGRLRWFGHVKRRPQSAPVRRVESLTVDEARRKGRPKLRWEDRLKTDLKEMLLSEDLTSDRNAWRTRIRVVEGA